ncbi:tripartite tricarboxylate transporter TctB family protein [Microbacterium sp. CFBP 13617]|uniref:tripartite tricarboxylate transporter TctB family protein n=1 Tax=Microbacterium sp. CFBP 13617 TaxID=2774035 RepID=UPI00177B9B60|nr:tripartite tricarboxylate transporter TctB family protein [Microbacterium sp. CFBP 13617]MBD8217459.1 tripartite tricarboxylate transporter TctB family protein [Microbacterium sp. CFBP 13617]
MASDVVETSSSTRARQYLEWSVVAIGAVAGIAVMVSGFGYGLTNVTGVGAGFFPVVAGATIALGAVLWALQLLGAATARRREASRSDTRPPFEANRVDPPTDTAIGVLVVDGIDEEDDDIALPDRRGVLRVAIVAGALVLSAILLPVLGYLITMTLLLFSVMTLVSARRWWVALLIAVGVAVISRFVFADLLGTALPHSSITVLRMIGL